jgi:hypothetical protein
MITTLFLDNDGVLVDTEKYYFFAGAYATVPTFREAVSLIEQIHEGMPALCMH